MVHAEFIFGGYSFDVALRVYLARFVLPGEAQKIDRILQAFAKAYFAANPSNANCPSEDAVYTLTFAVLLLNTDAHNPHLARKYKMTKDDFIRNFQGLLTDGMKIPKPYLSHCYDEFSRDPIQRIVRKPESLLPDEVELIFGDGPLGLTIETSIDGRTCLVRKYDGSQHMFCSRERLPQLTGWVIVAVGDDSTRGLGYPLTRYLLRTARRPLTVRFCEPSIYFASLVA